MTEYTLRDALTTDIDVLVGFTIEEAREAEGVELDIDAARRGVSAAFEEPWPSTYWVAQAADGLVVASTSVVKEWSNFHGGAYWWIQSLFITPGHRNRGLVDLMLNRVSAEAAAAGALDLRLYVHRHNERAMRAYVRCGFTPAPYVIMSRVAETSD